MHQPVARLIVVCLLFAGCRSQAPPAKTPAVARTHPPSVLEVPPEQMREALVGAYRLVPDNRVLLAVAEIHQFLSGQAREPVTVDFQGDRWQITYRNMDVGSLPEFPDFPDLLSFLSRWVKLVNQQYPLEVDVASPNPHQLEIKGLIDRFFAHDIVTALWRIDDLWNQGGHHSTLLQAATRGLAFLNFQALDLTEIADALPAKALAMLTLTQTLTSYELTREECILSHVMGYTAHSVHLAATLPQLDIVRLYMTKEDKHLLEIARQGDSMAEARYLWLLRLAQLGEREALFEWQQAFFPDSGLSLPFIKAVIFMGKFDLTRTYSDALPHLVLLEVAREGGTVDLVERLAKLLRALSTEKSDSRLYLIVRNIRERFGVRTSALMDRLDYDLQVLAQKHKGPFLDSGTYGSFYRGYLYSGVYLLGVHYLDQLSSIDDVKAFAQNLNKAATPEAVDFQHWYQHLAQFKEGDADPKILRDDLAGLQSLGSLPLKRTFHELKHRLPYAAEMIFPAARYFAGHLDTRPLHLFYLAEVAHEGLYDLRLTEKFYGSALKNTALNSEPRLYAWFAQFIGNRSELQELLKSSKIHVNARGKILDYLKKHKYMDDEAIKREYRRLIDEDPNNWDPRERYVKYLNETNQYSEAHAVITDWLERNDRSAGFDYIYARSQLAYIYETEGRYKEGWAAVEPVLNSWQAGAMQRATYLLDKMGEKQEAEMMARAVVERYPDVTWTRMLLAEMYWRHGKHWDAAETLKSSPHKIGLTDWKFTIAPKFVRVFSDHTKHDTLTAFSALLSQNFDHLTLFLVVGEMAKAGKHDVAFDMLSQLHLPGIKQLAFYVHAYRYLTAWKGEEFALNWLREQIPPRTGNLASIVFYHEEEPGLLWDLIQEPVKDPHSDTLWLMRAAASVRLGANDPHRQRLITHYSKPGNSHYHDIGQYLMGMMTDDEVLSLANTPNKRCEIAYYVALKAYAERRFEDAMDWFRVTVETEQRNNAEYEWAYMTLANWESAGKSLSQIAAETVQDPRPFIPLHSDPFWHQSKSPDR